MGTLNALRKAMNELRYGVSFKTEVVVMGDFVRWGLDMGTSRQRRGTADIRPTVRE